MNLKSQLFSDTNITGFTDSQNQPILVGHQVKDETGAVWFVHQDNGRYVVALEPTLDSPYTMRMALGLFVSISQSLTIVHETQ